MEIIAKERTRIGYLIIDGVETPVDFFDYYGNSNATKPIEGCKHSEIFYEMDTGKAYMFDQENQIWREQ